MIGGGPSVLAGAIACAGSGLKVTIINEFINPGGRLLGQLHQETFGEWWNGIKESGRLNQEAKKLSVDIRCGVSVYNSEKEDYLLNVHTQAYRLQNMQKKNWTQLTSNCKKQYKISKLFVNKL